MSIFRPATVITGASGGIGAELARVFAAKGHEVVLIARRERELVLFASEFSATAKFKPHVIAMDLQRPDAPSRIAHELLGRGLEPQYVVNNAAFGLHGAAAALDRGEQLAMIDLNVRALTDLSLRWVDSIARHKGGILNVASVAGFVPGPYMAVYYATKAYVVSFTEALARELGPMGIKVTVLCPGPVATEFHVRAGVSESEPPWPFGQSARRVAEAGYADLMNGKVVTIPGLPNKMVTILLRTLPRSLVLSTLERHQKRNGEPEAWSHKVRS